MKKTYLAILIVLSLLLCACIVASKAASARENEPQENAVQQTELPEVAEAVLTSTPEPEMTPEPEPTPEITPEPAVEVTPEPTPEVTPIPGPTITKHPSNETTLPGLTIYFIAKAENATDISWFLASPDGKEGINAADVASKFPKTTCTGTNGEMLGIVGVDAEMDGWKAICKFSGPGGSTFSEPAYIAVKQDNTACRTMDEVLVTVLNARDLNWLMAQGLSYTKTTGSIADYFVDSGITPKEVKEATQKYTQNLSEEHRSTYKAKAEFIFEFYQGVRTNSDSARGLLESCGYPAKYFPWDDDGISACFEALKID